jgi:hypothetical protein
MATQGNISLEQAPRRQFTLAGLLSFMVAVSVYFSMVTSVWTMIAANRGTPPVWPAFLAVPITWCVLWWLYRRWRLPQAMRVHCIGPKIAIGVLAIIGFFGVCIGLVSAVKSPWESFFAIPMILLAASWTVVAGVLYGCCISAAVSLPAATFMLLYLMLRPTTGQET